MKLIKKYLTQKSTYFGVFKVLTALGLLTLAPELEAEIANSAVLVVAGLLGLFGVYNTVRDEDKK